MWRLCPYVRPFACLPRVSYPKLLNALLQHSILEVYFKICKAIALNLKEARNKLRKFSQRLLIVQKCCAQ